MKIEVTVANCEKHELEYSIWSAKKSWCNQCHKHFYTDVGFHLVETAERITNEIEQLANASTEHLRDIALRLGNELKEANDEIERLKEALAWSVGHIECMLPNSKDYADFQNAKKLCDINDINGYFNFLEGKSELLAKENAELRQLLKRLHDWDMMDATADGNYWRKEIQKVLGEN